MGNLKNQFDLAFRDFNTDGLAASGPYDVDKVQVRAIGPLIESELLNLASAAASKSVVHLLTTSVSAGGALPFEVTALSGSFVGTGSGGTPGEYALTVTGGPVGHSAFITVGSDGKIASARIGARGIAAASTLPTYALPAGTGLTGATLPTATVTALAAGRLFTAPDATGMIELGWQSSGGVIAAWNVGGAQYSEYFKTGIDSALVPVVSNATTGRPSISSTATAACSAGVYIFGNAETVTRNITKMRVRRSSSGSINIDVAAYTLSGGQFTRVRGPVTVSVPGAATSDGATILTLPTALKVKRGEYLGFSIPGSGGVGIVFLTSTTGDSGGYFYHNVPGAAGPFTPSSGALITTIQLQIGFDGSYGEAYVDATGELQPQIDANVASTATNTASINDLSQQQPYSAFAQVRSGAYIAFPTGSPSSKAWAVGFLGTSVPAAFPLDAFPVTVHRGTGIETFEAMLYSRPIATTSAPSGSDVALWGAWVSVSAAAITSGAYGEVTFTSPTALANDQTKAYILVIRAKNSGGTIVDMGVGRALDVSAGLGQVQLGFYRDPTDTTWTSIGASAALNITVRSKRRLIKSTALPSLSSRKKRAALVLWGRTALVFSNATPKTYRRIFAVPANAARVVSVMFAHGGTSSIQIARAAVAPIASAANYAASGVTWTPLTFDNGAEGATIPAAAGAERLGWYESNENPVTLVDRSDVAGAAKLVAVSAYCSTAGNLTLLGSATDNDDYRTNWESRSDFPSVMRRNDGDCVTTPASFSSTTNQKSGTMIAGIVVECDNGELLSIAAVGDSITNGAGIVVSSDNTYGLGWVEKTAYGMNTAHRGVVPIMLGWSGIPMTSIANSATDFYAFVEAFNIPPPHILFAPNASPNSMVVPLTSAQMDAQLPLADGIARRAYGSGSIPIVSTVSPVNPSVKDFNADDSFRRTYNTTWRTRANAQSGYIVADMDAVMAGSIDGDGQMNLNGARTTDGIHPNAAGHDAMAVVATTATRLALPALGYAVGGLA